MKFQSNVFDDVCYKVCIHKMHYDVKYFDCDEWKPQSMYISCKLMVCSLKYNLVLMEKSLQQDLTLTSILHLVLQA